MTDPLPPPPGTDATAADADDAGGVPARRLWRTAAYAASVGLLIWAAVVVPLPLIEYRPGPPSEIEPLVMIDGVETNELDGRTALLTVVLRQQPTVSTLVALIDPSRELLQLSDVYPPDVDRDRYVQQQRDRFGRQFEVAAAVGAQAAGFDPQLATEAVIVDVLDGAPADGLLEAGDVVTAVDGEDIVAAEELQARARAGQVGDELTLGVRRDGEPIEVVVRLGEVEQSPFPVIGVAVETAVDRLILPFDISLAEDTRIGGPSAGMMVGITVYDLLADEDLLDGLTIAGTGTLDADGRVGPVGGIPQKMRAADDFGADLVLVPAAQLTIAQQDAPEGLVIVGVADLDEALDAIRAAH